MTPRGFDRYMLRFGVGTNPKLARLTDGEFRAHVAGILAIASASPVRGCLLVGQMPAEAVDVAAVAGVSTRVARSAIQKLQAVGVLFRDEEHNCLRVHDWDDVNPPPKTDNTGAERQARYRASNGVGNGPSDASVTGCVTTTEVEVEVEVEELPSEQVQRNARRRSSRQGADQSIPPANMPEKLLPVIGEVRSILHGVHELRGGREPSVRAVGLAIMGKPDRDHVAVAQSVEYWLTAGNGHDATCSDVVARYRHFLATSPPSSRAMDSTNVVRLGRPEALRRADGWMDAPEYRGGAS